MENAGPECGGNPGKRFQDLQYKFARQEAMDPLRFEVTSVSLKSILPCRWKESLRQITGQSNAAVRWRPPCFRAQQDGLLIQTCK